MKTGDFVKLKNGYIDEIDWLGELKEDIYGVHLSKEPKKRFHNVDEIIKSSPNIINLIEVGDYVNGRYVDKYQGKLGNFCELPNGKWEFIEISNEHYLISSIVTKEQFERMKYKVGE